MQYGGANEGSRTMIDALTPAFRALSANKSLAEVAKEARAGAEKTKTINKTNFGRSAYLNESALQGIVDPGAEIVARVFEKLASL